MVRESPAAIRMRLAPLLEPLLADAELELEDVELRPAGRRSVLRVVVDGDQGVNLDQIADVTNAISHRLDEPDAAALLGGGSYTLEVTSPGVDRPLTQPRHWRRNRGRLVSVRLTDDQNVTGRIVAVDDDGVELDIAGTQTRIAYSDVTRARVEVEFTRPASTGQPGSDAALDTEEE